MVMTVEEKDAICPRSYHHEHGNAGFTFNYLRHNINMKSVTFNCQRKRGSDCKCMMSFKRDKRSGGFDFSTPTHSNTHSRKCTAASNPSLDPNDYPWDGRPSPEEPADLDKENKKPLLRTKG